MSDRRSPLASSWGALVPGHPDLGAELARRYADPRRRYHNLGHLRTVLDTVQVLSGEAADTRLVLLAAWYHDAVYDVDRDDNEERSAVLAEGTLLDADQDPGAVAEVARLVRLTASHQPLDGDANGAVLCDADLVVLAGSDDAYASYVAAVRAEYNRVNDENFMAGRTAMLERFLRLPVLYRTAHGSAAWEETARRNLRRELIGLGR